MIWQTMMGESKNPKQQWDLHDKEFQHFSPSTGHQFIRQIDPGDMLVIYWPGHSVYMGISVAAEAGPHWLNLSQQEAPHNIDNWPYGLRIRDLRKIADVSDGVTLREARKLIRNPVLPGRIGLRKAGEWDGIDDLIDLIRSRASCS